MKVFDKSIGCRIIKSECVCELKMPVHSRACKYCGKYEREDADTVSLDWECPECFEALKRIILKERANDEQAD